MNVVGSCPIEVVAKTVADAVIVAKLIATFWNSSANPKVSVLIIVIAAVVDGFSFENFNVASEAS